MPAASLNASAATRPDDGEPGAPASSAPISRRYCTSEVRAALVSVTPLCASTAASSVDAEPSCRYGPVFQTSRNVGMSMPVSAAPRRLPLLGFSVPTFCGPITAELVNAVPPWQPAQPWARNTARPAVPAVLSAPAAVR